MKALLSVGIYRDIQVCQDSWEAQKPPDCHVDLFYQRWFPEAEERPYDRIRAKRIRAAEIAMAGDYDYLFEISDDILLPLNALEVLITSRFPVISGLHRLHAENSGGEHLMCRIMDPDGPQDSNDRYITLDDIDPKDPIIRASQLDMGVLLLNKEALRLLAPAVGTEEEFISRLMYLKWTPRVHTGIRCGHVKENGEIVEV